MWRVLLYLDKEHNFKIVDTIFSNQREAQKVLPFLKPAFFYERNRNKNTWIKNKEILEVIVIEKI